MDVRSGVPQALLAAALFGAATPFAARLIDHASPSVVAGLLYLGSGIVLALSLVFWPSRSQASLTRRDLPALSGIVVFGGGLGPLLLMIGLRTTPAATASLMLNLELVLTAALAWLVFREHIGRRVALGLTTILAGGVLASFATGGLAIPKGSLAVAGACLCWSIDNNLTQIVSGKDPRQIASIKGVLAGGCNLTIGLAAGDSLPSLSTTAGAMGVGVIGYGGSLMLFVLALRSLGAARTGAYYALAPFVGVLVALTVFEEPAPARIWPALSLVAIGVAVTMTERHDHLHLQGVLAHSHVHRHDDLHHDHQHLDDVDGVEGAHGAMRHVHEHVHEATEHRHQHRPDLHHRHG